MYITPHEAPSRGGHTTQHTKTFTLIVFLISYNYYRIHHIIIAHVMLLHVIALPKTMHHETLKHKRQSPSLSHILFIAHMRCNTHHVVINSPSLHTLTPHCDALKYAGSFLRCVMNATPHHHCDALKQEKNRQGDIEKAAIHYPVSSSLCHTIHRGALKEKQNHDGRRTWYYSSVMIVIKAEL